MPLVDSNGRPLGNSSTNPKEKQKPVEEVALGMNSIFWGVRNPLKTGLRGFGFLCATLGCLTVIAGAIYWMRGDTTPANLSAHPGDIGRWLVDKGARPVLSPVIQSQQANDVEQWLYRQPNQDPSQFNQPEDFYRPEFQSTEASQ